MTEDICENKCTVCSLFKVYVKNIKQKITLTLSQSEAANSIIIQI